MADDHPYLSYIFIAIFVAFITAIFTENSVIKRIGYSEGIIMSGGKCKIKPGFILSTGTNADADTDNVKDQLESIKNQLDNIANKLNKS